MVENRLTLSTSPASGLKLGMTLVIQMNTMQKCVEEFLLT
jgi:hypothetical protein